MLRVTPVDTPAPGDEWLFTIPGQYIYDVRSIVATYFAQTPGGVPTVANDVSGNAQDGAYAFGATFDLPGLVAGDTAVTAQIARTAGLTGAWDDGVTLECWYRMPVGADDHNPTVITNAFGSAFTVKLTGAQVFATPIGNIGPNAVYVTRDSAAGGDRIFGSQPNTYPNDGAKHHVAVTFVQPSVLAAQVTVYVDGAAVAMLGNFPAIDTALVNPPDGYLCDCTDLQSFAMTAVIDEIALYPAALTAGQVAAHHAAAAASFPAYAAAVLGDTPEVYLHVDESALPVPAARYSALNVTDGTHALAQYTSGELSSLAGPIGFQWQPGTSSVVTSPESIVIGIPPLILPAGYTVGSITPALGNVDQWSDIAIWWDDALSPGIGPGLFDQYANVLLLP